MPSERTKGSTRARSATGAAQHLSVSERVALGKAARAKVPRSSHAAFAPAADRSDPVELLERQAKSRVPELVPVRYGRMLVSPFTFYRGAALIMASDLAATPAFGSDGAVLRRRTPVELRRLRFPGAAADVRHQRLRRDAPRTMGVGRQASGGEHADRCPGQRLRRQGPREDRAETVGAYRSAMAQFATMKNLDVWYSHLNIEQAFEAFRSQFKAKQLKRGEKQVAKARTKDSMAAFAKLTEVVDGEARIVAEAPLIVPIADLATGRARDEMFDVLRDLLRGYRETLEHDRRLLLERFRLVDLARKVVGVGSVGTRAWIALMLGRDNQDPLFLQIKEAEASVLEEFVGPSEFENHGERVVRGQRLMQATSDIFLGWLHVPDGEGGVPRDFYVRQLKDWKGSAEVERMVPLGMAEYGKLCGWTLASAHARSGDRVTIAAYLGRARGSTARSFEFSERTPSRTSATTRSSPRRWSRVSHRCGERPLRHSHRHPIRVMIPRSGRFSVASPLKAVSDAEGEAMILAVSTLGWIVLAAIWVALAFWPARVAGRKGHSFVGYFILSLFFFPLALITAETAVTAGGSHLLDLPG